MLHSLQWWKTQKLYIGVVDKNKVRCPEKEYDLKSLIDYFEGEWLEETLPLLTNLIDRVMEDQEISEEMLETIMSELGDCSNTIDFIADWIREIYNLKVVNKG